jgi:TonB family protein
MKSGYRSLVLVGAVLSFVAAVERGSSQTVQSPDASQAKVVLTKLFEPTYPLLARQARIAGDVDLMLTIRRDGSVESAVFVSGHPMLKQAALDSAQRSQFECIGCVEAVTSYAQKYKFQITTRGYPKDCDYTEKQPPAEVDVSRHEVTVSAWAMQICDPASTIFKNPFSEVFVLMEM